MGDLIDSWWWQNLRRELSILRRQKQSLLQALMFFLMFAVFFPLAIPYDAQLFHTIFPGIIWLATILAVFLASERFYVQDVQYGCLEQWLVLDKSLFGYVMLKMLVHGLILLASMLVVSPIMVLIYHLSGEEWGALVLSLTAGLPAIIGMCALVNAFGCYGQDCSLVMILVLFPLILPVMMLGSSVMVMAGQGLNWPGLLALLFALSLATVLILPFASAYILKTCLEQGL